MIEKRQRRSIRLKGFDYSRDGAYFITICTEDRECLFGKVVNGEMLLNEYGEIIGKELKLTETMRTNIKIDEYAIMPNHVHFIISIDNGRGTLQRAPTLRATTFEQFGKPVSNSIPTIVRLLKSTTTKQINELRNLPGCRLWQRNYYEHVIRDDGELNRIRQYIIDNPAQWDLDDNNPKEQSI